MGQSFDISCVGIAAWCNGGDVNERTGIVVDCIDPDGFGVFVSVVTAATRVKVPKGE